MEEYDLANDIADGANAIQIGVTVDPPTAYLFVRRFKTDPDPLLMTNGSSTIIGTPARGTLFVSTPEPVASYSICVLDTYA